MSLTHRLATLDDIPAIKQLMRASMEGLLPDVLTPVQVKNSYATMGLDTGLIKDGTYFLVFSDGALAGCGGWSRRRTLYGGDHMVARDDSLADPHTEPAKTRAMYTHPDFTRRGIGSLILSLGEDAARAEGFKAMELGATASGILLYEKRGYKPMEDIPEDDGVSVPNTRMRKLL
ncbi:MAG: GNAT family N-acetyltransferase [Acidimicrobiales bacterium]|nr:GNAT family N-acetyltransferase [Hyphomonadaceae bacterium]RZV44811.1 MAG: GNAT family N-acetyltransferase [Acidimicrobiales bacterium]